MYKMTMIKKLFYSLILICSLAQAQQPIILWDIHDVLLQPEDQLVTLFTFPHKKDLFSRISWRLLKSLTSLIAQHLSREVSSEEYIHAAIASGNPHLAELIVAVANAQRPIPGMRQLVQELHELGIEQHIGSNIGKTAFYRLLDGEKHPRITPLLQYMNLDASMVSEYVDGRVVKKPNAFFFERYLEKNNLDPRTTPIIFIDDRWDNVRVAQSMGFDGILFQNPNQLRTALRKRGIQIRTPAYKYSHQCTKNPLRKIANFYRPVA